MSLSMVDASPSSASSAQKRRSAQLLKTKDVAEIGVEQRVLKAYAGTSEYRKHFFDVWVKARAADADECAVQTAVIQCKQCGMLMRNEGGHIKNHVVSTCQKRASRSPKELSPALSEPLKTSRIHNLSACASPAAAAAAECKSEADVLVDVVALGAQTENTDPLAAAAASSAVAAPRRSPTTTTTTTRGGGPLDVHTLLKEQALLLLVNNVLAGAHAAAEPRAEPGARKRKHSDPAGCTSTSSTSSTTTCAVVAERRVKPSTVTRRKMRQNMLRTKDMEQIGRDRFVLKEYLGTSEYRKQFFDVWVKARAADPDDTATETAVIQCKNCERIMSNEGGHIKSHVQSACKGLPEPSSPVTATTAASAVASTSTTTTTTTTTTTNNNNICSSSSSSSSSSGAAPAPSGGGSPGSATSTPGAAHPPSAADSAQLLGLLIQLQQLKSAQKAQSALQLGQLFGAADLAANPAKDFMHSLGLFGAEPELPPPLPFVPMPNMLGQLMVDSLHRS